MKTRVSGPVPTRRNVYAAALANPLFRKRIVHSKKLYSRKDKYSKNSRREE